MKIVTTVTEMQTIADKLRSEGKRIAFVPTMGYLHTGHTTLMRKASEIGDIVVTSIFVNPTQFGPHEDFEKYPKDIQRDSKIASENGTNILFHPSTDEIYPMGHYTRIVMQGISDKFEGTYRPGHFDGVALVIIKLFAVVKPHLVLLGQKDYQQTLVINQIVKDLLFDVRLIVVPTIRQSDGLAMSSRNIYLSTLERTKASIVPNTIKKAIDAILNGEKSRKIINAIMHAEFRKEPNIRIDYASSALAENLEEPEVFNPGQQVVILVAIYIGKTRLIDNSLVTVPTGISLNPQEFKELN